MLRGSRGGRKDWGKSGYDVCFHLTACLCRLKMNAEEVISFFQKRGALIHPDAVNYILKYGNGIETCREIASRMESMPLTITIENVIEVIESSKKKEESRVVEIKGEEDGIKILKDVTGKLSAEGDAKGFVNLFRNRYEKLYELVKKRYEMKNAIPIKSIGRREEITTIGIVRDARRVKNGMIVELEDEEDSIKVYVPKDVDNMIINDEVIGIEGRKHGDLIIVKNVVRPEIPITKRKAVTDEDGFIIFTSDIHIGSKSFLEKKWDKFIEWINGRAGNERQREVAKKIKYMVIPGDVVEGIGIYPKQEEDLIMEDIYQQYEELAKKINMIPDKIEIILQPGNHDAVRPPLPQPAFEDEIKSLFAHPNIHFVGNPCYIKIDGITILSYHGQSIQDFATALPGLSQNEPAKIMREMLKRRHMAPMYGSITSLAPEKEDYMIIDILPDIFVTGHIHTTQVDYYRNILLVNASSWQEQTEYQKMMNFMPDPAKVITVNMKNMMASIMAF